MKIVFITLGLVFSLFAASAHYVMPLSQHTVVFKSEKLTQEIAQLHQEARCKVVGSSKKAYEIMLPTGSKGWVAKKSVTRIEMSDEEFNAVTVQSSYSSTVTLIQDVDPDDSIMLLMPEGPDLGKALEKNKDKEQQQRNVE